MTEPNFNYSKPIRTHFSDENAVLVCLFPFYHQIFKDHYNWEGNLKLTYPLVSTLTWQEISADIGFNSLNRLAQGILALNTTYQTELEEYCDWKKIDMPNYAADKIPEVILIPFLRFLKNSGATFIETKANDRFPDSVNSKVDIDRQDEFEIFHQLQYSKHITTDNGIEILLPDYDCPYAIIAGNKKICRALIDFGKYECFDVDSATQFDWWNELAVK